jgi:hypothetical protein
MEEMTIVSQNKPTQEPVEISKTPIRKRRTRKKAAETTVEMVERILKNEADSESDQSESSEYDAVVTKRISEWKKRKEKEREKIRVRFRDYATPNILRTIEWQAYNDWPVNMWKVRDGDIITMDRGTIRGLTAAGKKRILEPFNEQEFGNSRSEELKQTKYIEKIVQLYGFESLEFDASFEQLPTPQILRPRSEVIFAQ